MKMIYKSAYIQKGYGIGGIFRSVAKFFRPIARNVTKVISQPEVQKVLKTIGKETASAGSELLLDSLRGNNIESKLDQRIKVAKQRIVESIEDGIRSKKRAHNTKNYQRIDNDDYEISLPKKNPEDIILTHIRDFIQNVSKRDQQLKGVSAIAQTEQFLTENITYKFFD